MNLLRRFGLLPLFAVLLLGCFMPTTMGFPVAVVPPTSTSGPGYVQAPPDATATPTPFQPIPPTAAYLPTDVPLPTDTPPPTPDPLLVAPEGGSTSQMQAVAQPKGQMNVLLLGADKRPWDTQFRTDTIILVTLNAELGRVNLTSFPRDLYITIPGRGMGRINTAYTYGGFPLLADTFQHNFGVYPDHYILINFSSFKKIIDNFGGLDVNVAEPLSDYRYGYWVTIPAGEVHMDADTVLWYVRSRKTTNDFARTRRQQEVLQAIFEKLLTLNAIKRAPEFYSIYKENVTMDLGLTDMLSWLPLAAKIAETRDVNQYYINSKHVYDWITPDGGMVLLPNQDAVMNVIRKSQNIP